MLSEKDLEKNRQKRLKNEPTEGTSLSVSLENFKLKFNKINVRVRMINNSPVIYNNTIIKKYNKRSIIKPIYEWFKCQLENLLIKANTQAKLLTRQKWLSTQRKQTL